MSFEKRLEAATRAIDCLITDTVERYRIAMKEDFAELGVKLTDQTELSDLSTLLRLIEVEDKLQCSLEAVMEFLEKAAAHLVEVERSTMPEYPLLFCDVNDVLRGYRPENAWEESKFVEEYGRHDHFGSPPPVFSYPSNGDLEHCEPESDFKHKYFWKAKAFNKKLEEKDGLFTSYVLEQFQGYDWGRAIRFGYAYVEEGNSIVDILSYLLCEKVNSEGVAGEIWEE